MAAECTLHVERGGAGERLLVLLHGLGANSAVWRRLIPILDERWQDRWIAPDFRGHGRSPYEGPYGYAAHAADIAALIGAEDGGGITLLGHSFGGVVAALVGTGWYGPRVREVLAFGVKIEWTEDEVGKARELALRPARTFATHGDAASRYLKMSGLHGLIDPASPDAAAGVKTLADGFQVAMDPRAYGAVGPSIETILRRCAAPVRLAAGARDPMVAAEAMRRIDPGAVTFEGVDHNVHWKAPEQVWNFIAATAIRQTNDTKRQMSR